MAVKLLTKRHLFCGEEKKISHGLQNTAHITFDVNRSDQRLFGLYLRPKSVIESMRSTAPYIPKVGLDLYCQEIELYR